MFYLCKRIFKAVDSKILERKNEIKYDYIMKKCTLFYVLFLLCGVCSQLNAQVSFSAQADLQSRYVWRGLLAGGNCPSLQPGATLAWKGVALDVWGAYSLTACDHQELDWTLSYTVGDELLRLQLTDYSFPTLGDYRYFDYRKDFTDHVLEVGMVLNIPSTELTLSAFCNIWGNDARNADGSQVFSAYAELGYSHAFEAINTTLDCAAGCALNGGDMGGFYGNDGFALVNLSVGFTYEPGDDAWMRLPVNAHLIANPNANMMWLVCGTTIPLSK